GGSGWCAAEDALGPHSGWQAVKAGGELCALGQRYKGGRIGAEIADPSGAKTEKAAGGIEREPRFAVKIAAGIVAQERLVPLARPFDRPPDAARGPAHQREFWIEVVAGAEVAADFLGNDPHPLGVDAQDDCNFLLGPHHGAAAGIQG